MSKATELANRAVIAIDLETRREIAAELRRLDKLNKELISAIKGLLDTAGVKRMADNENEIIIDNADYSLQIEAVAGRTSSPAVEIARNLLDLATKEYEWAN